MRTTGNLLSGRNEDTGYRRSSLYQLHQFPENLISLFITHALEDELIPFYGDWKNVRGRMRHDRKDPGPVFPREKALLSDCFNEQMKLWLEGACADVLS